MPDGRKVEGEMTHSAMNNAFRKGEAKMKRSVKRGMMRGIAAALALCGAFDVLVPPNTTAVVRLPGEPDRRVGSGAYSFSVSGHTAL